MNNYGDIGNATRGWYFAKLLSRAVPVLIIEMLGLIYNMPMNQTRIAQFRRANPLPDAITPLSEGVTPDSTPFSYTTISVQIQQYGDWSEITDVVDDLSKDNVLGDIVDVQGDQVGKTRERIAHDVLRAGTNIAYGSPENVGTINSRATVTKDQLYTHRGVRADVRHLNAQQAQLVTEVMAPSPNYETYGIEASYIALAHTDLKPTLRDLKGTSDTDTFKVPAAYGTRWTMSPYEVGSFEDVRYMCSPHYTPRRAGGAVSADTGVMTSPDPANPAQRRVDVYDILTFGREFFGIVPLRGRSAVMPIVKNPAPRGGDPLGQRGWAGWKMWYCVLILMQAWGRRREIALST